MLRPERMSKVSVTGSKRVIDDVIEATYEHHSLHVTDYDERYEGFSPGESLDGAESVNERLVTVRSLESILDVEDDEADKSRALDDEELEAELADVRDRVNDLNDRRDDFKAEIRDREEEIDRMEPFADLGIELDLLGGYDSLEVVVGEAKPDAVEATLADADGSMRSRCSPGAISSRSSRAPPTGPTRASCRTRSSASTSHCWRYRMRTPARASTSRSWNANARTSGTTSTRLSPNSRR